MKNILFIVSWYNPKSLIGSFFIEQAEYLSETNVKIYFLFETEDKDYLSKIKQLNDRFYLVGIKPILEKNWCRIFQKVIAKMNRYLFIKKFKTTLGNICFSGVIAQNIYKAGHLAYWLKSSLQIPYAIIQHKPFVINEANYFLNFKNTKRILRQSDKIFCVSHDLIRQLRGHRIFYPADKIINPIGLKIGFSHIKNGENINGSSVLKIGLSGQYGNIKNQKLLFDSLALLNDQLNMPINVVWLGYASWGKDLPRDIMDCELSLHRLNQNVKFDFFSKVERKDMAEKLRFCDIFVSTSFNETFGIAQIEALSLGIPVITTQNGGCNEFMEEQYGIVVNSFNPEDFAAALISMIHNLGEFNPKKISEKVRQDFSKDIYIKQLQTIPFLNY